MLIYKIKDFIINKFIKKKDETEGTGFVYKLFSKVTDGHPIWESKRFIIVMPYELLYCIAVFVITTVSIKICLHPSDGNWFKDFMDIGSTTSVLVVCQMHIRYHKQEKDLSHAMDRWWTYTYLDQETMEIKRKVQQKLEILSAYLIRITFPYCGAYVLLPFLKFFFNGAKNAADIMVVDGLHEVPWIYFEIVCGVVSISCAIINVMYTILHMIIVSHTHGEQMKLAGLAFSTIEQRVLRMLADRNIPYSHINKTFEKLVQSEIKSCAMNYQTIYRQTKKMHEIIATFLNFANYLGCSIFIATGVLVAKERHSVLMVRVFGLLAVEVMALFLFSYPVDYTIHKVEKFKLEVYSSPWFNLPISCQKSVYMMQTMLMNSPKFTTFLGSVVSVEFYGTLINAGYCYITALLAMENK